MLSAFLMPCPETLGSKKMRKEAIAVGRKNRRNKREYRDRLGFDPNKYIKPERSKCGDRNDRNSRHSDHPYTKDYRKEPEHRPYRIPHRGEVWFAELGFHPGTSVQNGCRPVMIVSNDKGNHYAATIVVLPLTSQLKKCDLPSHVELRQADMTKTDPSRPFEDSMILAEQITTIAKSALRNYVGKVENAKKLNEISDAVKTQLAI